MRYSHENTSPRWCFLLQLRFDILVGMKQTTHSHSQGHVGLVTLLVTVATIILVMVGYFGSPSKEEGSTGETKLQRDMQAIEDAKSAKDLIEQRNQIEVGE